MLNKLEADGAVAFLFSADSPLFKGLKCELKDLLNKEDNDGSFDVCGDPAKAAGWNDRLGIC